VVRNIVESSPAKANEHKETRQRHRLKIG
jgi:hypothetical protein